MVGTKCCHVGRRADERLEPRVVQGPPLSALEVAGVSPSTWPAFDGRSFWPLARGDDVAWRSELLYEYYWERNFPHTPTTFALRGDRYKFVRAYGVWDVDELYDLEQDPGETRNLIFEAERQDVAQAMRQKLFATLRDTGDLSIPLQPDRGNSSNLRRTGGTPPASFPPELMRKKSGKE